MQGEQLRVSMNINYIVQTADHNGDTLTLLRFARFNDDLKQNDPETLGKHLSKR